jgi:Ca2+-binding EF-hand superfamily protein
MKSVSILAALGIASAALVVYADPAAGPQAGMHRHGHGHGFERLLKAADTNGDGVLSRDEALAFAAQRFDALDANHDGQLTADEIRASFRQKRAERWKKIDTDGDGRISKAEAQANAPRLAARFDQLDANGDGYLTPEELRAGFRHHRHGPSGQ